MESVRKKHTQWNVYTATILGGNESGNESTSNRGFLGRIYTLLHIQVWIHTALAKLCGASALYIVLAE